MSKVGKAIRDQIRGRADRQCEYCHRPERTSFQAYHVEHVISVKHGGSSALDNLAWSCVFCNSRKGTDIGSRDPLTGEFVRLFNPRSDLWAAHFDLDGVILHGKTAIGRATVQLLQMNDDRQIEVREQLINSGLWQ